MLGEKSSREKMRVVALIIAGTYVKQEPKQENKLLQLWTYNINYLKN